MLSRYRESGLTELTVPRVFSSGRGTGFLGIPPWSTTVTSSRTFAGTTVAIGLVALVHAVLTWPMRATLALFGGGAAVAFLGEAVVIRLGLLEHHIEPKVAGVPIYILFGWTGVVYLALRVSLLVLAGLPAVLGAAALATAYDIASDHRGVADGHWSYLDDLPGPRYRDVPWWNYLGWFAISGATGALAVSFL